MDVREFENPHYDRAAFKLLSNMECKKVSSEKMAEIRRCLRLGIVRSDWLSVSDALDLKIRESKHIGDKNYWICMKKLTAYTAEEFQGI